MQVRAMNYRTDDFQPCLNSVIILLSDLVFINSQQTFQFLTVRPGMSKKKGKKFQKARSDCVPRSDELKKYAKFGLVEFVSYSRILEGDPPQRI